MVLTKKDYVGLMYEVCDSLDVGPSHTSYAIKIAEDFMKLHGDDTDLQSKKYIYSASIIVSGYSIEKGQIAHVLRNWNNFENYICFDNRYEKRSDGEIHYVSFRLDKRVLNFYVDKFLENFNPMKAEIVLRAENYTYEEFENKANLTNAFYRKSLEYLVNEWKKKPVLIAGNRGMGKTYSLLMAFNNLVKDDVYALPIMIVFKKNNKIELLNPYSYASGKSWGEREKYLSLSMNELIKKATHIAFDDVHYIAEAIEKNPKIKDQILPIMKTIVGIADDKPVLLLSETQLSSYEDGIDSIIYSDIVKKVGDYRSMGLGDFEGMSPKEQMDYYNNYPVSEVIFGSTLERSDVKRLFYKYGVIDVNRNDTDDDDAGDGLVNICYSYSPSPRELLTLFLFLREYAISKLGQLISEGIKKIVNKNTDKYAIVKMGILEIDVSPSFFSMVFNSKYFDMKTDYHKEPDDDDDEDDSESIWMRRNIESFRTVQSNHYKFISILGDKVARKLSTNVSYYFQWDKKMKRWIPTEAIFSILNVVRAKYSDGVIDGGL